MGVTVQVRNLDADVQERLREAAEKEGLSLSAFLRRELTRLAEQLTLAQRFEHAAIPGFRETRESLVNGIREDRSRP
jgi:plasmid stability protein